MIKSIPYSERKRIIIYTPFIKYRRYLICAKITKERNTDGKLVIKYFDACVKKTINDGRCTFSHDKKQNIISSTKHALNSAREEVDRKIIYNKLSSTKTFKKNMIKNW